MPVPAPNASAAVAGYEVAKNGEPLPSDPSSITMPEIGSRITAKPRSIHSADRRSQPRASVNHRLHRPTATIAATARKRIRRFSRATTARPTIQA